MFRSLLRVRTWAKMSEKLCINPKAITGPSFSTETMHMKETVNSTAEDSKNYRSTTKKYTSDLQAKTENADHHEDPAEEEIDEDETNAVHESGKESGNNSTVEIKQAKFRSENDTHTRNAEERANATGKSRNEINASTSEKRNPDNGGTRSIGVGTGGGNNPRYGLDDATISAWAKLKIKENHGNKNNNNLAKKIGLFALKTAAVSGIILGGTALIVPAIGFGAAGVTAGSLAATYQSAVLGGTIASGSAFATLQSIGAAGLSAAANSAIVAGSAAASGVHTFCKKDKKGSN